MFDSRSTNFESDSSPSMEKLLDPASRQFYQRSIGLALQSGVPFLVGGAFALEQYTGIVRDTKDLDFFVRRDDCERLLQTYVEAGYEAEMPFPHWLAKAHHGDHFIDIIFSSGNGLVPVDDEWFSHAAPATLLGAHVWLSPVEEMIWSKSFVMERERFDGADIAHLLLARADALDWNRLMRRFDDQWRVLLSHLILFGFTYPGERHRIPQSVIDSLTARLQREGAERPAGADRVCQGVLLSREQYLHDLQQWGYEDARLRPGGTMTHQEIETWTDAIES